MAEHSENVRVDLDEIAKAKAIEMERWVDGYINHSATALRTRALAAMNGHSNVYGNRYGTPAKNSDGEDIPF